MRDHRFSATTRSVDPAVSPRAGIALLATDEMIGSPETGLRYRIGPLLGIGGFGQAYLAQRLGRSSSVPSTVCVKVSARLESWVREAYFGQLLDGHPRAIQLFDRFPITRPAGATLYCLVLEYAVHGDLGTYLHRTRHPFSEASARRQIASMLDVLVKLHRSHLLHRDVTPFNVFVCEGRTLKLGDFGIMQQQTDRRGVLARTLNPHVAPREFLIGDARRWQARDDVYQIGQLLAMLLLVIAGERVHTLLVCGVGFWYDF
jgi:serine/threonine protein kinase